MRVIGGVCPPKKYIVTIISCVLEKSVWPFFEMPMELLTPDLEQINGLTVETRRYAG